MCSYNFHIVEEVFSDLGPYCSSFTVRWMKELPRGVFCPNINCPRVRTWSYLLPYLQCLRHHTTPHPQAQYMLVKSTNGCWEECRWTGGVQNAPWTPCCSFLNQPFLGVRQLFGGATPPFWGPLCVGTSTVCQTCQELGGHGARDFSRGRLQHLAYFRFCFSTDVTKDSSLEWLLLKYRSDLQVRGTRSVF